MGQFRIRAYLRVRPSDKPSGRIHFEYNTNGLASLVRIDLKKRHGQKFAEKVVFNFDDIIQGATQESVYEKCAAPLVTDVLNGYNANIVAYGQVGSGKTFTMKGDTKPLIHSGIIPRCISRFFEEKESKPDADIAIHVSYLEIYNDVIYDLLMKNQAKSNLVTMEEKGVMEVRGLSRTLCRTASDALKLFFEGEGRRSVASHPLNRASSRSHTVFTIYVERHVGTNSLPERTASRLNLVDLAGVERFRSPDPPDPLMREAMSINKSLTFLEQAVFELRKGQNHVSFRQSRLTSLLRDAVCGNSKTLMIFCAVLEDEYIDETISVSRFAQRLRELKTRAEINKTLHPAYVASKYEQRIANLREELALKDALTGREGVKYDEMDDDLKLKLQNCVSQFLAEGGTIEDMPVDNLAQVKEMFRLIKQEHCSLQDEVNRAQAAAQEAPAEEDPGVPSSDQEEGVGELDGEGFHIGEAPPDARPEAHETLRPPVQKDPDAEVAAALEPPVVYEEPSIDKKNAAFIHFKHNVPEGNKLEVQLKSKNNELRLTKKFAHEAAAHIHKAKTEIAELNKLLEERSHTYTYDEENQALVNDERREIRSRLKNVKMEYRTAFEALRQVKRDTEAVHQEIRDLKRNLLEAFYTWFEANGRNWTPVEIAPTVHLDEEENGDGEETAQLQEEQSTEPMPEEQEPAATE